MRLLLLNGPNLNLLGTRRPDVYGSTTLADLDQMFRGWAADMGVESVETFQSNHEGSLIDRIHDARGTIDGIVFNPGAYTHSSYALHDAIESVEIPTVEVHISNVEEREAWRRISLIRPACVHTVYGRGIEGYRWGMLHLVNRATWPVERIRYGSDGSQFADLRMPVTPGPRTDPMPLVVLVHGGFWRHQWTLDTTESIAVDLARRGVATLNIEYRRIGAGGSATTMVEDVREAITTALDDERLDPLRWAIAGHSAGGQLAIAAVADMDAAPPRLTTTMGGVSDLAHGLSADLGEGAVAAYLGDEPPQAASPVDLAPLRGRLLIAHGTKDDIVPFEQAERLIGAQRAAGGRVDLHSGAHGHFEYLDPSSDVWQKLAVTMLEAVSG